MKGFSSALSGLFLCNIQGQEMLREIGVWLWQNEVATVYHQVSILSTSSSSRMICIVYVVK